LRIADYNNHICICFVLFCFVIFSLFCFSRGHNWDIIPASRHNMSGLPKPADGDF